MRKNLGLGILFAVVTGGSVVVAAQQAKITKNFEAFDPLCQQDLRKSATVALLIRKLADVSRLRGAQARDPKDLLGEMAQQRLIGTSINKALLLAYDRRSIDAKTVLTFAADVANGRADFSGNVDDALRVLKASFIRYDMLEAFIPKNELVNNCAIAKFIGQNMNELIASYGASATRTSLGERTD
ncbi:hypothetical protein [Deinococcus yavapaiensis]|uniref:Uncharacterized protein n=1 Tax=Deinococcus yavapaiensis KR-236 TaxID=694435 RepID=A0A318SLV7_9DEIO|nr:hypothetical protein [Deinococcus yavapaiensis]PYE55663.1 hypothetical protein DES52_10226 [Deinococcus yavapaiensis KR-236]